MNEAGWKRLIDKIREGNVVPIIGSRLLVWADGRAALQAQIAARLLHDCGKDAGEFSLLPFREINEAVSQLKGSVAPQDLYDAVYEAIRAVTEAKDFTIPTPIRQLAEIAHFRLFVTLTPDDLLARSLRRRCAVNEIIHSPNLTTSEGRDLLPGWQTRPSEANVLYLFGKSRSAPMFAIHDEDVLEYAHNVIANGPKILGMFLGELQQRNLLLIGCNFPEWLSRFFLRSTNQKRLSENYRRSWLIEQLKPEESFTCFLSAYGGGTEVLSDLSPVEFVAELHQRWMNEHGAAAQEPERIANEVAPRGAIFFISYSRQTDLPRAESLYQSLLKLGVTESEVWFDRKTLEPGEDFQRGILDGIRSCRYFLPLLSRATNKRQEAFVFIEWGEATQRLKGMNRDFLIPVIVDADFTPDCYTAKRVREWADQHLNFAYAPEGRPDEALEKKLRELVSDTRRENEQS
jgi:TIR domain